ncbi:ABC transporter permease [Halalkalibacterium halodurans]|uniref:BH0447 protein n=2 Tax=Halalkalibacterium halodurans TaxID=86665 RepID=Q9KFN2_HALH5|nr:ABC transporter permease [Halalkalibacterium halodurans]MDY7220948.1 ABC transporter permease [Halalkalibacterium halodurans]MDY7240187.1 ABC transporter permease [Halalkalibacterium halodurans]MED3646517.1 ABC transporter permease [Halalkalibacterium halodurans]MED4082506.1 ABC transporter permease [Halalkalibacterium halodurans]MED4085751.1 ABC transporter permease [Halalkalibacterium halodurans]
MFFNVLEVEWNKLKHMKVWIIVIAGPLLASVIGFFPYFTIDASEWIALATQMILAHSALFLPLLTGIYAALICSYEHQHGGWKQLLALPVERYHVYIAKFVVIITLLLLTQIVFFFSVWLVGVARGYSISSFTYMPLLVSVLAGFLSCLPLAALQLWLATRFTSFAAPSVMNVMLTVPAILIANSEVLGPLYPWAHPLLSMTQGFSMGLGGDAGFLASNTAFVVTLILSFLLFSVGGVISFQRKQWT